MSLISKTFDRLADRKEGALIAYVTGGDPDMCLTEKIIQSLVDGGADIVEVGIPFSDPIADGPTIQAATSRALKAGATPTRILNLVKEVKKKRTVPLVLLTYFNPIYRMGLENFFESAATSHVDGVIVPDLPVEESLEYKRTADTYGVDTIFLVSPSTSDRRFKQIVSQTSGFLYLVSLFGVTGTRRSLDRNLPRLIIRARRLANSLPVCAGFGISTARHVVAVLEAGAEGVIVGSALVEIVARNSNRENLPGLIFKAVRKLKAATQTS